MISTLEYIEICEDIINKTHWYSKRSNHYNDRDWKKHYGYWKAFRTLKKLKKQLDAQNKGEKNE